MVALTIKNKFNINNRIVEKLDLKLKIKIY